MGTRVRHWVWLSIFSFVTTVCSPILPRIRLLRNMNFDLGQRFLMRPPPFTPRVSLLQSLQWEGRHGPPPHLPSTARKVPLHVYSTSISQVPSFSENPEGFLEAKWWMGKAQGKNYWQVKVSGTKHIQCLRKYSTLEVLLFAFLVPSLPSWMKRELTTCWYNCLCV